MRNLRHATLTTPTGTALGWAFELPSLFCPGHWTSWVFDGRQYGLRCDLPAGVRVEG